MDRVGGHTILPCAKPRRRLAGTEYAPYTTYVFLAVAPGMNRAG